MKKLECLLLCLCGTILLCTGCDPRSLDTQNRTYDVLFVLEGDSGAVRSTVAADELSFDEMCVYIVNAEGDVVDAVSAASASVVLNLAEGSYRAYAAVNCGLRPDSFSDSAGIRAYVRNLTEEAMALSMFGSRDFMVPDEAKCTIPVMRLVSKVEIRKFTADFSHRPALAAEQFSLDSIYLINVAGQATLAADDEPEAMIWLNQRGYFPSGAESMLCDAVGSIMPPGGHYSTAHYFYCYQNGSIEDSHDETWSPRHTRLVLACTIGSRRTYYPVDIVNPFSGTLTRNGWYVINELKVTGLGADGPDRPLPEEESMSFSAQVLSWDGTYVVSEVL
jgi:hypothetical protein